MFDFATRPMSNSTIVIEVKGQFSESNRSYFFDCLGDFVDAGYEHIIIECHKLGYVTSGGLAHLLRARQRAQRQRAKIYLTHLDSHVGEILEVTKLGRMLAVFPTTKDAIASIENQLECVG